MRNKKLLAALTAAVVLLSGCYKDPESTTSAGRDFSVDKLFTVDGCTVYRFWDSKAVYFSNCKGRTEYDYNTQSGKINTTHKVQTVNEVSGNEK